MSLNEEMINQQGEAQEAEENEAQQAELSPTQELETKLAETEDRYKRVLAEYQNFRTRSQKEREAMYLDNVASTVNGFLPVIDTLERAMLQETDERFKKSIEMIIKQYTDCLDHFNVKAYAERGDVFDPNLHNAVMMCDDDELESGAIAEVLLKGYILGDKRVVRHAMVRVAN
ncbi:MAG: nucleotide exchange factor GrpE [Clostridia bacterium]|nr:nucleotide exchange factor GrpE [Clostridia bacterium]